MKKTLLALFAALTLLTCGARAEIFFEEPPERWDDIEKLEWTIFDVNEGDAMLLTCGGESMLVDGGPMPFRVQLSEALKARGLEHLTTILNTHYHDDHIDGIYYLFRFGFTADEYVQPYSEKALEADELGRRTARAAQANGVPVRRIDDGDVLTVGSAKVQVIKSDIIYSTNARSLVLKVTFKESSILLCADIIGEVQHDLVETRDPALLDADLIKMPHHAITPAVPEFLDAVSPEVAIVTSKEDLLYEDSIIQLTLRDLHPMYSGDGTVYAVTDGEDWYIYQTRGQF